MPALPQLKYAPYRKAWQDAGHPGKGSVYLRVPVYVGATQQAAIKEPCESITYYFARQSQLVAQNARSRQADHTDLDRDTAQRLAALTYEQILETKVAFGSAAGLKDRLTALQEELGLDGIVAEMNAGGMLSAQQVTESLRILTQQVMPAFK